MRNVSEIDTAMDTQMTHKYAPHGHGYDARIAEFGCSHAGPA